MAFTGKLGTSKSLLGDFQLGSDSGSTTPVTIDATLSGGSSVTSSLSFNLYITSSLQGESSVQSNAGVAYATLTATCTASSQLTPELNNLASGKATLAGGSTLISPRLTDEATIALIGGSSVVPQASVAYTASSTLSGESSGLFESNASLALTSNSEGTSALSASCTTSYQLESSLAGAAFASATLADLISSNLSGDSSVYGSVVGSVSLDTSLSGGSNLIATNLVVGINAGLSATSSISSDLTGSLSLTSGLVGVSSVLGSSEVAYSISAVLGGSSSASAGLIDNILSALQAGSDVTASGLVAYSADSPLVGGSSVGSRLADLVGASIGGESAVIAELVDAAEADFTGESSLTASLVASYSAEVSLSGDSELAAVRLLDNLAVSISGSSLLSAGFVSLLDLDATLSGGSSATATLADIIDADLNGEASLVPSLVATYASEASFSGESGFSVTQLVDDLTASISGTSLVSADVLILLGVEATLGATSSLVSSVLVGSVATLAGDSSLDSSLIGSYAVESSLSANSDLDLQQLTTEISASLSGESSVSSVLADNILANPSAESSLTGQLVNLIESSLLGESLLVSELSAISLLTSTAQGEAFVSASATSSLSAASDLVASSTLVGGAKTTSVVYSVLLGEAFFSPSVLSMPIRANLSASSSISAVLSKGFSANLAASSSLVAPRLISVLTASVVGESSATINAEVDLDLDSALSSASTFVPDLTGTFNLACKIEGSSTIHSFPTSLVRIDLVAGSSLVAPVLTSAISASLVSGSSLVAPRMAEGIRSTLTGASEVTCAVGWETAVQASLQSSSSVSSGASCQFTLSGSFEGSSFASGFVVNTQEVSATLEGSSGLAPPELDLARSLLASLAGASSLVASVTRRTKTFKVLYASSGVSADLSVALSVNSGVLGNSGVTCSLGILRPASANLDGSSSVLAPYLIDQDNLAPASLSGEAFLASDLAAHSMISCGLHGESVTQVDATVIFSGVALVFGESGFESSPSASYSVVATLSSSSGVFADIGGLIEAQLPASSEFVALDFVRIRNVVLDVQGDSGMDVQMYWHGHPGPPPQQPTINSAETLKGFIDALGLTKEATRTPTQDNLTVVINPRST